MNEDEDDFDGFDSDDEGAAAETASETVAARGNRIRKSWRDIERLREQRELERLSKQDNWFDDLDRVQ